jgi:4'-phosphopantetheinyl transferase
MALALDDRVGLWYVRTKDVTDVATLDAIRSILTAEERKKHGAYVFERNRHEYLVTRAVERGVLAACLGKAPGDLAFTRTDHGRPELVPRSALRFNLTNTVEMVACAVAMEREVGVDAEPLGRGDDVIAVADTVFTANERAMLHNLALGPRRRRAVELWTLKEAYIKARGLGMSLPVDKLEVCYEGSLARGLRFFDAIDDDASRWLLATREIGDHLVSVCVERRAEGGPIEIAIERADLAAMLAVTGGRQA